MNEADISALMIVLFIMGGVWWVNWMCTTDNFKSEPIESIDTESKKDKYWLARANVQWECNRERWLQMTPEQFLDDISNWINIEIRNILIERYNLLYIKPLTTHIIEYSRSKNNMP